MEAKAIARHIRIAPRKNPYRCRFECAVKTSAEAFAILKFTPKVGADVVEKLCVLQSQTLNIISI